MNLYDNELINTACVNLFKQTIDSIQDSLFIKGIDGKYIGCNKAFEQLMGYSEADIIDKTAFDLYEPALASYLTKKDAGVIETKQPIKIELLMTKQNGIKIQVESSSYPLLDDDHNVIALAGIFHEITARKKTENALKQSEEKYRMIAENSSDAIWIYNLTLDRFTFLSPSITQLTGFTVEEVMALKLIDLLSSEHQNLILERFLEAKTNLLKNPTQINNQILELQHRTKKGDLIWVEVSARMRFNELNEVEVLGVSRNIEERKKVEQEIRYLGYHDQLTGAYNRYYLEAMIIDLLEQADRTGEPISMVELDLDHFKTVNDTWGHQVGDDVLRMTAQTIEQSIRNSDLLFRFGGEEFIILMPNTNQDDAVAAAEKIRQAIADDIHPVAGQRTVSIGIVQHLPNESFRRWYMRADEALYQAKESGRNRVVAGNLKTSSNSDIVRMNWQPEWESGHAEIDRQHQELVEMANQLINKSFGVKHFDAQHDIQRLLDHVVYHFRYEENILANIGFPRYMSHVNIHNILIEKALHLQKLYQSGEVSAAAFFSFVVEDVVLSHLIETDTMYYRYTRQVDETSKAEIDG